jgi:hypothetical protein
MDPIIDPAFSRAAEGISILTAPLRWAKALLVGFFKQALYFIAGVLVLCCGVLWVAYHFVLRLMGTPVDWSDGSVYTGAALIAFYAFIILYPFIGLWTVGISWVMYRKQRNELKFGEGFVSGLIGLLYGFLVMVLAIYLYAPGMCNWNLGPVLIILTATTLLPLAISLCGQGKSAYLIAMVTFLLMEVVTFSGEIEPHIMGRLF